MSDLEISNAIRHHRNNIHAWRFRQSFLGEDWSAAIAHAEAQIAKLSS
jgi:hypothetical protein